MLHRIFKNAFSSRGLAVLLWATLLLLGIVFAAAVNAKGATPTTGSESQQKNPPGPKWFVPLTVGGYFSCEIPADWSRDDTSIGASPEEKRSSLIALHRPMPEAVPLRIAVIYYAEGDASIEQFISAQSRPVLGLAEGDSSGPTTEIIVSGRRAKSFDRRKNEFVPMLDLLDEPAKDDHRIFEAREKMARTVPVTERFVIVPAASGFYVLSYYAPTENFQTFLGKFERVTATFNALR